MAKKKPPAVLRGDVGRLGIPLEQVAALIGPHSRRLRIRAVNERELEHEGSIVVSIKTDEQRPAWVYVLERINCGSPRCRQGCRDGGHPHGPYWYAYAWINETKKGKKGKKGKGKGKPEIVGKTRSIYIGAELVSASEALERMDQRHAEAAELAAADPSTWPGYYRPTRGRARLCKIPPPRPAWARGL